MLANELQQKYDDVIKNFAGKDRGTVLRNGSYDRKTLIEAVFTLMETSKVLIEQQQVKFPTAEEISEACLKKTESLLVKLSLNQGISSQTDSNANDVVKSDNHVLLIKKDDEDNSFTTESWSDVVSQNISKKLENIPVSKTILNKGGKGCIILPDESSCSDAKLLLQEEFNVEQQTKKPFSMQPRI